MYVVQFATFYSERSKGMYIFTTKITKKDGTVIYAKDYGKKAFRIWVGPGPEPKANKK